MLYPTPELDVRDRRVLEQVDELCGEVERQVGGLSGELVQSLRRWGLAEAAVGTHSIGGIQLSSVDVRELLDGGRGVGVPEGAREDVLGYQRMVGFVRQVCEGGDARIGAARLKALHWFLRFRRAAPERPAGQWRSGEAGVGELLDPAAADPVYSAPPPGEVPGLVGELTEWLNAEDDGTHPVVKGAMAHLHLVAVRPWDDGNGRVARALQTLVVARASGLDPAFCSVEAWLGRPANAWAYVRQLRNLGPGYRPDRDVSDWVRFQLDASRRQAQEVRDRLDRADRVWTRLGGFAEGRGLGERTAVALHEVAMTGRMRRARFGRRTDDPGGEAVRRGLRRDLRRLVAADVLAVEGPARARCYSTGPAFPSEALEVARTPLPPAAPASA